MTSHTPTWPLHDAKARFSELVERCLANGPQIVSRRGKDTVVVIPMEEWQRLQKTKPLDIKEWLLSDDYWRGEMDIPPRGRARRHPILDFSD